MRHFYQLSTRIYQFYIILAVNRIKYSEINKKKIIVIFLQNRVYIYIYIAFGQLIFDRLLRGITLW